MNIMKPELSIYTERSVIRDDISTTFDVVFEINSAVGDKMSSERRDLNICLVIDKSGSMSGDKLETAKKCCINIAKRLQERDMLSVVTFDDVAQVVFNPNVPRNEFESRILSIRSGGQTDLASGWRLGLLELQTHGNSEQFYRVILLSDGQANVGETKKDVLERDAEHAYQLGIITSTLGIGKDFQEDLLHSIAKASGGNFWFVEEHSLENIIETEFEGALSIIHEHARLRLDLPTGVDVDSQLNSLQKAVNNEFRLPPLWKGKRYAFAWRLKSNPEVIKLSTNGKLTVGATLLEQGVTIKTSETTIDLGNIEQFATSKMNAIVVEEVEKFMMSNSEEKALQLIESGDIEGLKDLIVEMRDGMRIARSQLAVENEQNRAEQERMQKEMELVEQLNELIHLLGDVMGEEGISESLKERLSRDYKNILGKIMHHRHDRHDRRGWRIEHDDYIEGYGRSELLAVLWGLTEELLRDLPEDPEILRIREKINERLEHDSRR
jgi:Ca-activated chloride channel homolog